MANPPVSLGFMNSILVLAASALVLVLVLCGLRRVPAQRALAVHRFGRYRRILGPGWHWILPGLERVGPGVDLIGHRVTVAAGQTWSRAELYYQIVEPEKAGAALESVDDFVAGQAREALGDALGQAGGSPDQLKHEVNRRVGKFGLRVIRCSLLLP